MWKSFGSSNLYQYVLISLLIVATIYNIYTKPFSHLIKYSAYVAFGFGCLVLFIVIVAWIGSGFKRPSRYDVLFTVLFLLIGAPIVGMLYYSGFAAIKDLYYWILSPNVPRLMATTIGIAATAIIGLTLFLFRLHLRSIYGFTEAFVGLLVAGYKFATTSENEINNMGFYLAILTAAVYLVVRGMDNIHQGMTKQPFDPVGIKMYSLMVKKNKTVSGQRKE